MRAYIGLYSTPKSQIIKIQHMPSQVKLYPSRLTITPQRTNPDPFNRILDKYIDPLAVLQKQSWEDNFLKANNPFLLSRATKRKIFDSINSMYELSPARKIQMQNGKEIYNFRCSFITLTLPAKQMHDDKEIKAVLLNQFLVEMRKVYKVQNYVWKAELQKNGNIHFHIITDRYIDYQALRRRWNRLLNKLGYVDRYQSKMAALSLIDYHKMRCQSKPCEFEKSQKAYATGKKDNWKNPNSIDVRSVSSSKDLATYLGKYIGKNLTADDLTDEEIKRMSAFGRSWGRSESLSRLQYRNYYDYNDILGLINIVATKTARVLKIVGDWFTSYHFSLSNLPPAVQKWYREGLVNNSKMYNYPLVT